MDKRYVFDPGVPVREIVLVGLGGTGSHLARSVARIVYDLRARNRQAPGLRFVDPDAVEMKNVGRQLFAAADVGRYKAEVLAKRFSAALGLPIAWNSEPFDPRRHLGGHSPAVDTLLLGAVDNADARRALSAAHHVTWLDAGNHFSSGQVVIGNSGDPAAVWRALGRQPSGRPKLAALSETLVTDTLPYASLVFPALLAPDPAPQPELSCADLVELGEQHLLINDLIADVAAQYVYKLLHRQPIRSFATFVDAESLAMRSVPITAPDLEAYLGRAA